VPNAEVEANLGRYEHKTSTERGTLHWFKVVHDISTPDERLRKIRLQPTDPCMTCKQKDTLLQRPAACGDARVVMWRRYLLLPSSALWRSKNSATVWLVSYLRSLDFFFPTNCQKLSKNSATLRSVSHLRSLDSFPTNCQKLSKNSATLRSVSKFGSLDSSFPTNCRKHIIWIICTHQRGRYTYGNNRKYKQAVNWVYSRKVLHFDHCMLANTEVGNSAYRSCFVFWMSRFRISARGMATVTLMFSVTFSFRPSKFLKEAPADSSTHTSQFRMHSFDAVWCMRLRKRQVTQ
jgi:hypothetical protein